MEKKLIIKNSWYFSLFIMSLISGIYATIFVSKNFVFNIGQIDLFKNSQEVIFGLPLSFNLPMTVSRIWDLPLMLLIIFFIIKNFYYIKELKNKNNYLICGLVLSLLIGFSIGALSSFIISLSVGIIISLLVILICGLFFGFLLGLAYEARLNFLFGIESGWAASLIASLICILTFGSLIGLAFGFILGLAMFIGVSLGVIIRYLFSKL